MSCTYDILHLHSFSITHYLQQSAGVVVSVGGQIPNNLSVPLSRYNVKIVGTHPGIKQLYLI